MASFNRIILAGNLVHSPDLKHTQGGTAICKINLAVNSRAKKGDKWEDEVSYFDLVAFGKTGEAIAEHVAKGQSILIEGRLKQERWEKEGQKKSAIRVYVDTVQFLSPKNNAGAQDAGTPDDSDVPF